MERERECRNSVRESDSFVAGTSALSPGVPRHIHYTANTFTARVSWSKMIFAPALMFSYRFIWFAAFCPGKNLRQQIGNTARRQGRNKRGGAKNVSFHIKDRAFGAWSCFLGGKQLDV